MAERPLPEYAAISAAFGGVLGGFLLLTRGRLPERVGLGDVVRIGAASYKIGRLVAKDEVTTWVRAPVTQDEEGTEPKPRGAELVEAVFVDAEVMSDLVEDGDANLLLEDPGIVAELLLQRNPVDGDLVRE